MKRCSKCKVKKSRTEFSRNIRMKDGLSSWCKSCIKEYKQSDAGKKAQAKADAKYLSTGAGKETNRKSTAKWGRTDAGKESHKKNDEKRREEFPEKEKAHHAVNNAIRAGRLIRPSHCEECREEKFVEGHHWSYEEEHWLIVDWLCTKCHRKRDKEKNNEVLFEVQAR